MRLHPPVTQQEALEWLTAQAAATLQSMPEPPDLKDALQATAEAMAAVSATILPDDIEPLFP